MFEKSRISSKMNETELKNYGKLAQEIKTEIEKTKLEIQKAKEELQKAKIYRKNRIEYEVIANVIDSQPERTEMSKKIAAIKKDKSALEVNDLLFGMICFFYLLLLPDGLSILLQEIKQQLDKKLEMRKKHFHVLIASLHQLKALLDSEEENGESNESAHINISDDEMELTEVMDENPS